MYDIDEELHSLSDNEIYNFDSFMIGMEETGCAIIPPDDDAFPKDLRIVTICEKNWIPTSPHEASTLWNRKPGWKACAPPNQQKFCLAFYERNETEKSYSDKLYEELEGIYDDFDDLVENEED